MRPLWFPSQAKGVQSIWSNMKKMSGKNHFAHMCLTKNPNSGNRKLHEVEQQSDTNTNTDEDLFLGELGSSQNDKKELFTDLNANDKTYVLKLIRVHSAMSFRSMLFKR